MVNQNETREPNIEKVTCRNCHEPFDVRVPECCQASLVMEIWNEEFGGLCRECFKNEKEGGS